MTVKEMAGLIGTEVHIWIESLGIRCTIIDVKQTWGQVNILIVPVGGSGEKWVSMNRVMNNG